MWSTSIQRGYIWLIFAGLSLFLPACELTDDGLFDPEQFSIDDVIEIKTEPSTILANGVDRTLVTATLKGHTPDGLEIEFETDGGTFASVVDDGTNSQNQQEIAVKASGKQAQVFLISSIEVTKTTVSATVKALDASADDTGFTVFSTISFTRANPDRIILSSNLRKQKADGQSVVEVTADLISPDNAGTVSKDTRIIFQVADASTGAAVPELRSEALSDASGKAKVQLSSRQARIVRITASVESVESDPLKIEFENPNSVPVE